MKQLYAIDIRTLGAGLFKRRLFLSTYCVLGHVLYRPGSGPNGLYSPVAKADSYNKMTRVMIREGARSPQQEPQPGLGAWGSGRTCRAVSETLYMLSLTQAHLRASES